MIWLYDEFETDFKYNGIVLNNAYDADIHWVLNDYYKITFKYPTVDNDMYSIIEKGMIVKADEYDRTNLFRIKDIDINENDKCLTVTAYQLGYDFNKRLVNNFSRVNVDCQSMLDEWYTNFISNEKDFSYYSDISRRNSYSTFTDDKNNDFKNSFTVLGEIANIYSADIDMHNKQISLLEQLGKDTEEVLTTAKNISEFVNTSNADEIITRLYVTSTFRVGDKDDKDKLKEQHKRELEALRRNQKEYTAQENKKKKQQQLKDEINKKYAKELAKQNKTLKRTGVTYKTYDQIVAEITSKYNKREETANYNKRISQQKVDARKKEIEDLKARQKDEIASLDEEITINLIVESPFINDYPFINEMAISNNELRSAEELEEWATRYFTEQNIDKPKNSIKVTYEQLKENINRGDTVILKYLKYNIDERIRVVETHYDPMLKKWKEFILGEKEGRLGTEVANSTSGAEFRANEYSDRISLDIEKRVREQSANFDRVFNKKKEELETSINDGIERAKAKAEQEAGRIATEVDDEINKFKKQVEETLKGFNKDLNGEEFNKKLAELKKEILTDTDSDMDEIRKKLNETSDKVTINSNMIGGDGKTYYNKNRVKGDTDRLIALGTPYIEIEHNGNGFEVGKDYTISWQAVCNVKPHGDINIIFNKRVYDSVNLNFSPHNVYYPTITKNLTANGKVSTVYFDNYSIGYGGNFYKNLVVSKNISTAMDINLVLSYKELADALDGATETVWNENSDLIFDGGNN